MRENMLCRGRTAFNWQVGVCDLAMRVSHVESDCQRGG